MTLAEIHLRVKTLSLICSTIVYGSSSREGGYMLSQEDLDVLGLIYMYKPLYLSSSGIYK